MRIQPLIVGEDPIYEIRGPSILVASATASIEVKRAADPYVCDGTADNVEINAAIAATLNVVLSEGTFHYAANMPMRSYLDIGGVGKGTKLTPSADVDGFVIPTAAKSTTELCVIHDLWLEGGKASRASGSGIVLDNGAVGDWAPASGGDVSYHTIRDVHITDFKEHGIWITGSTPSGGQFSHVFIHGCDKYGFYCQSPDAQLSGVAVGTAGLSGFYFDGSAGNAMFSYCSAYYCGATTPATNYGFYLGGSAMHLDNCSAQDNYGIGYRIDSHELMLGTCLADSNGRAAANTYDGFDISAGAYNLTMNGCTAFDRHVGGDRFQRAGIFLTDNCHDISIMGGGVWNNITIGLQPMTPAGANIKIEGVAGYDGTLSDPGNGGAIPALISGYVPIVTTGAQTRTLAAPNRVGLELTLYMKTDSGDCVVTCATTVNETGNNTITFSATGQAVRLISVEEGSNLRWRCVFADGAALSTVA